MVYAYSGNVVFQMLACFPGHAYNAPLFVLCAVISGGLSGANFPMTAALVSDYYGETNNDNYGSIYAFKALGGSFAGGLTAYIMTGTRCGAAYFHWLFGFIFGAALGALAAPTVGFPCKPPTAGQMERATQPSAAAEAAVASAPGGSPGGPPGERWPASPGGPGRSQPYRYPDGKRAVISRYYRRQLTIPVISTLPR